MRYKWAVNRLAYNEKIGEIVRMLGGIMIGPYIRCLPRGAARSAAACSGAHPHESLRSSFLRHVPPRCSVTIAMSWPGQREPVVVPPSAFGVAEGRQVVGFYWCGEAGVWQGCSPDGERFTCVDHSGESCDCKHGVSGMQSSTTGWRTPLQQRPRRKIRVENSASLHTTKAILGG